MKINSNSIMAKITIVALCLSVIVTIASAAFSSSRFSFFSSSFRYSTPTLTTVQATAGYYGDDDEDDEHMIPKPHFISHDNNTPRGSSVPKPFFFSGERRDEKERVHLEKSFALNSDDKPKAVLDTMHGRNGHLSNAYPQPPRPTAAKRPAQSPTTPPLSPKQEMPKPFFFSGTRSDEKEREMLERIFKL